MTPEPALNKTEVWIAEHSIRILLLAAVVILVGGYFIAKTVAQSGETAREVTKLKPQVTKVIRAASVCSLDATRRSQESRECAMRMRIALINCRRYSRCRAALLSAITYPPPAVTRSGAGSRTAPAGTAAPGPEGGDAVHQPSHQGHQQPGPSGGQQEGGQEASPAPSAPEGGSGAGQGQESPGNGAQGSQGGSSSSGAGVELCVLERTCVGVEVGVDPKGILP